MKYCNENRIWNISIVFKIYTHYNTQLIIIFKIYLQYHPASPHPTPARFFQILAIHLRHP